MREQLLSIIEKTAESTLESWQLLWELPKLRLPMS